MTKRKTAEINLHSEPPSDKTCHFIISGMNNSLQLSVPTTSMKREMIIIGCNGIRFESLLNAIFV